MLYSTAIHRGTRSWWLVVEHCTMRPLFASYFFLKKKNLIQSVIFFKFKVATNEGAIE